MIPVRLVYFPDSGPRSESQTVIVSLPCLPAVGTVFRLPKGTTHRANVYVRTIEFRTEWDEDTLDGNTNWLITIVLGEALMR